MSKRNFKQESGFTLIELVVTMAVMTVLSLGGFVVYAGLAENAADKSEVTVIKSSDTSEESAWEKNFDEEKDR